MTLVFLPDRNPGSPCLRSPTIHGDLDTGEAAKDANEKAKPVGGVSAGLGFKFMDDATHRSGFVRTSL